MLYAIIAQDCDNSLEKRRQSRPEHLKRLVELLDQGRLVMAGAHPAVDSEDPGPAGFSGSLVIAEFDSLEEAQAWAEADVFRRDGIWQELTVKPFRKALP